jgi:GTPase SAR1 family protein
VIGEANTGKTSLINCFFNLKEPIGLSEKTDEAKAVLKLTNGVVLWDAPAN